MDQLKEPRIGAARVQLDTETATIMMRSAERANAMAEEATRRVVELMQEAIEYRERIAKLEAACVSGLDAVSRLRTAIDSGEDMEKVMIETAENQRRLEVALGL